MLKPIADRKSTRLNSSHMSISYAGFCLKHPPPPMFSFLPLPHSLPIFVEEMKARKNGKIINIDSQGGLYAKADRRSEEHTSELQSHVNIVCRLLLETPAPTHVLLSSPTPLSSDFCKKNEGSKKREDYKY